MTAGDHGEAPGGPLAGVRVVELAGMGVVPYAAMILGDLGAEVIRVDRATPGVLDSPASLVDGRPVDFLIRRSRRSIALDLKSPEGANVLLKLVESADALIEGFRPGVVERLGVGPVECRARNPKLVYVRTTGWGQEGPYADAPGHDLNYLAISGALQAMGRRDLPPAPPLNLVGDFAGGALFAVVGLLSGVLHARASGEGEVVDAAMVDGIAHLTTLYHGMLAVGAWREEREDNILDGGSPLYDVYETSDGRYLSVVGGEPEFRAGLFGMLELTDVFARLDVADRRNWPEARRLLADAFRMRTLEEWEDLLATHRDVCAAPVLSFTEAPTNEHYRSRGTFVEHEGILQPAPAPRFGSTEARLRRPPPVPGQHSVEILRESGFTGTEIELLTADGTVVQAEGCFDDGARLDDEDADNMASHRAGS